MIFWFPNLTEFNLSTQVYIHFGAKVYIIFETVNEKCF